MAISRAVRARTSHAARRTSTSSWRLRQSNIISADGQARDFSHQNGDIEEQETGVELAPKLPQIVPITTTPGGSSRKLYSTALNQPWRNDILLYALAGVPSAWVRRYQLTNSSHPVRGESFVSLLCSTLAIPHHCFFLSPKLERKRTADHATLSPALKDVRRTVSGSPPLSLSLSLCPGIPTFRKSENPRFVFFLFLHSKRVAAAFSLPRALCLPSSLCCLPRIRGHASSPLLFFLLSTRFATSLTFVFSFFFLSFSHQARVLRPQQSLSADADPLSSNILALLLDASTVGTRAEDLSPSTGDSGSGSQASSTTARELR